MSIFLWWSAKHQATLVECGETFLAIKPDNVEGEAILRQSDSICTVSSCYCKSEVPFTEEYWEALQAVGTVIDNPFEGDSNGESEEVREE
jgi:hypothetical protein